MFVNLILQLFQLHLRYCLLIYICSLQMFICTENYCKIKHIHCSFLLNSWLANGKENKIAYFLIAENIIGEEPTCSSFGESLAWPFSYTVGCKSAVRDYRETVLGRDTYEEKLYWEYRHYDSSIDIKHLYTVSTGIAAYCWRNRGLQLKT